MTDSLKLTIWDRAFSLPIEYECYKDEKVTKEQKAAVKNFAKHKDWIDASKSKVEKFCREQVQEDEDNQKKDNIFSYIKPDYLFVKRDDECSRVALMCKYRYEPENGLAIVYSSDGKAKVGIQDIIL